MKNEITVNGLQQGGNVLTILEGKALEDKYPVQIKLSGNIESIANFLKQRYGGKVGKGLQAVDKEQTVVVVDEGEMNIKLFLDPQNPFGTEIAANLEITEELDQFNINPENGEQFTREALVKLIRFNKRFFDSVDQYEGVLNAYMKLNLSFSGNIKAESDYRGNRELELKKQINSEKIPTEFILKLPVFKGQPAERFRVEVCLDATDASVRFWFESTELVDIIDTRKKEIFAEQLKSCEDFVIISK